MESFRSCHNCGAGDSDGGLGSVLSITEGGDRWIGDQLFRVRVAGFLGAVEVYVYVNGEDPFAPVLDESLND